MSEVTLYLASRGFSRGLGGEVLLEGLEEGRLLVRP